MSGKQQKVKIGDTFSNWNSVKRGVPPQASVLGPVFLIYSSTTCFTGLPKVNFMHMRTIISYTLLIVAPENCICCEVRVANEWYHSRMIVNETNYQAIVLGKTDHSFSFSLKDSLDIFGLNSMYLD